MHPVRLWLRLDGDDARLPRSPLRVQRVRSAVDQTGALVVAVVPYGNGWVAAAILPDGSDAPTITAGLAQLGERVLALLVEPRSWGETLAAAAASHGPGLLRSLASRLEASAPVTLPTPPAERPALPAPPTIDNEIGQIYHPSHPYRERWP